VVGNKSFALDGAGSPFNFQALFSFLRAVVSFSLVCVAHALRSLPSRFNAGIWCYRFNIRRRFGGKPSSIERFRTRRIPVFALFGLCIATAPWSVHSQVNNCETCQCVQYVGARCCNEDVPDLMRCRSIVIEFVIWGVAFERGVDCGRCWGGAIVA
jgi:hypothetical protein